MSGVAASLKDDGLCIVRQKEDAQAQYYGQEGVEEGEKTFHDEVLDNLPVVDACGQKGC